MTLDLEVHDPGYSYRSKSRIFYLGKHSSESIFIWTTVTPNGLHLHRDSRGIYCPKTIAVSLPCGRWRERTRGVGGEREWSDIERELS